MKHYKLKNASVEEVSLNKTKTVDSKTESTVFPVKPEKAKRLAESHRIEDEDFEPDAHCCSKYDDGNGYCTFCGAIITGSWAEYETYGGEPPERKSYHWSDL